MSTHTPIPIKDIIIPPDNRKSIDKTKLDELAQSMQAHGLLNDVVVHMPPKGKKYDLIAGERRIRAATQLGWKEIGAKVLMNLSEDEIRAMRLTENLQREDLTPWEEAEHLAELQALRSNSRVEDLADQVGRSATWVAQRLAIGKLIPDLRELVITQNWPLSHLPLLARVPADGQADVLKVIREEQENDYDHNWTNHVPHGDSGRGWTTEPRAPTLRVLQDRLSELERNLAKAPWKTGDAALLPAAGSCDTCPKRTSAQALLFPELVEAKDDRCLDAACWAKKEAALIVIQVSKLKEKGAKPILIHGRDVSYQSRNGENNDELHELLGQVEADAEVEDSYKYEKCKKSDPKAQPAVVVGGEKAGTVEYVKPYAHHSSNGSAKKERPIDQDTGKPKPPGVKERMSTLLDKRKCRAVELWSERLPEDVITVGLDVATITDLVVAFGTNEKLPHREKKHWTAWQDRTGIEPAWEALYPVFQDRLKRFGPMDKQADGLWSEAVEQAKAIGREAELDHCYAAAVAEIKLPKVLASTGVADPDAELVDDKEAVA